MDGLRQLAPRVVGAESLWRELARLRARYDVRRHPLCVRWQTGEVSCGVLASYAEEYDHILVALATICRRAAFATTGELAATLHEDAADREALVDRWRTRAQDLGWGPGTAWYYGCDPLPETRACCRLCLGEEWRPVALDLVTLVVFDQVQPSLPLGSGLDRAQAAAVRLALGRALHTIDASPVVDHARALHGAVARMLDAVDAQI